MSDPEEKDFRPVNQILGTQPSLGPIPANQIIPWTLIVLVAYFLINGFFGGLFPHEWQKWLWTCLVAGWGMATWWILSGGRSWRFLSKFVPVPRWTRGMARYISFLGFYYERKNRKTKRQRQRR